jgi:HK97 family phage prohead protease
MTTLAQMKARMRELDRDFEKRDAPTCDCDCPQCADDDCGDCTDASCSDPNCVGCPAQEQRSCRRKRLLDMKRDVRLGRTDASMEDIRRRKRLHDMRYDPDTSLMVMRLKRNRMGSAARSGDVRTMAAEYRALIGNQPERREFRSSINIEAGNKIVGYAAVFNSPSQKLSIGNRSFIERILPGAFDRYLRSNPNVVALLNHDQNLLLGRTTSKTLTLEADSHGLRYEIFPPATSYANDLLVSMRRGDLDSSSFAFTTIEDNWIVEDGETIREVVEANVWDVSPVTSPAYPAATSGIA